MDFRRNKFLIIVIAVIVVEIGVYFWLSGSYSTKIGKELSKIKSSERQLNRLLDRRKTPDSALKNDDWVRYYRNRKARVQKELNQCVAFYSKRDKDFEKHFPKLGSSFDLSSFWLRYGTRWKQLITRLKKAGVGFARDEEQDKTLGFARLTQQPPNKEERDKAQKGFWIHQAIVNAMIQHKATAFYESKITYTASAKPKINPAKLTIPPPFHFFEIQVTLAMPYHKLNLFLADLLRHKYLNFVVNFLSVNKEKFEIKYKTIGDRGNPKNYTSGDFSYFDRAYFQVRLPENEFKEMTPAKLEAKYVPPPAVKIHLRLSVLDFDKKLLVDVAKLTAPSKKRRSGRRGRRGRRRR